MGPWIGRLIAAQDGWARPLGDFNKRWLSALFQPIRPLKNALSGVWLGHPLHAAWTDIPIGTLLLSVVLDLPPAVVLARNAGRSGRVVDEAVVRRHLGRLRMSLDGPGGGLLAEGFGQVVVLRDAREVEEVRIRRSPT